MSNLDNFKCILIGFCSYPAVKFIALAIWDKMINDAFDGGS